MKYITRCCRHFANCDALFQMKTTLAVSPPPSKVNRSRPCSRVYGGFRYVFPRGSAVKNVAEKNTAPVRLRFAV